MKFSINCEFPSTCFDPRMVFRANTLVPVEKDGRVLKMNFGNQKILFSENQNLELEDRALIKECLHQLLDRVVDDMCYKRDKMERN